MDTLLFTLNLCVLLVVADYAHGTRNVAIGKTASMSSNHREYKWLAQTAVDGNVGNNSMLSDTCFHTTKEYQPWWRVDLHQDYYITSVVVYNRLDCCANQARKIKLTIGKSLDSMSQAGHLDGGFTTTHTFTVDPPLVGRFVQLQLYGITEFFHLCEVEVMAYPSEFSINTTVISGIFGGVCAMVILGATGILLTRKYSKGCFSKADEKSEETSRNPDAPVDTVPSARDSEIYTEIEETSDCQAKRSGETSFTVQTTDPSQYEELRASVSNTYTKLER
ncbi:fucolectin-2-like isoform X3 [Mya arenaria]|uniref:fucolectin-2-like isoform X3 n=1 Tax=Mya arenaria TaxID=6604 RepID=UPI0022E935C7|nr:fucolectin-2-like isoform X3 [Mya arenaria]